ncbi:hypothetical protein QYE76_067693 [Lolium multiflorum]|uniref:F-box domain-containing protein n=1 Tax=Lolium multiflorum TaxID=4521 RepID=A0AAD8SET4_LOLMU|nr:hypothetical protein QYE76_067693 [Lolium multiflorum]
MEATAVTLPDDIVLEILVRLADEASLFRCGATCKLWRCLVTDSSFLRRRWPADKSRHPSCLIGFFANDWFIRWEIKELPVAVQTFVPGPRSVLGLGRRSLAALVPVADSLFDRVAPLASHGGLLLVRFVPAALCSSRSRFIHLAVCNLFAGTCEVLPPLLYKSHYGNVHLDGFAILTGADFCSNDGQQRRTPSPGFSTLFKVLIIGTSQGAEHYELYMFSSDHPSWSAPRRCLDRLKHKCCHLLQRNAVVRRGTAHWLCWDYTDLYSFDVNADTGHVSLAKLALPFPQPLIFFPYDVPQLTIGANGELVLVRLHIKHLRLEIWTRQESTVDTGAHRWLLTRVTEIEELPKQHKPVDRAECVCFGDKSGTLFLVDDSNRNVYLVDAETGAILEEMTDRFSGLQHKNAIPVDIDWPAFFVSRLRGQYAYRPPLHGVHHVLAADHGRHGGGPKRWSLCWALWKVVLVLTLAARMAKSEMWGTLVWWCRLGLVAAGGLSYLCSMWVITAHSPTLGRQ